MIQLYTKKEIILNNFMFTPQQQNKKTLNSCKHTFFAFLFLLLIN